MKTFVCAVLIAVCPITTAAAQDRPASSTKVVAGKFLFDAEGKTLGSIYKVTPGGGAQLVMGERLVTVPSSTINQVEGKFVTSLTKKEVLKLK